MPKTRVFLKSGLSLTYGREYVYAMAGLEKDKAVCGEENIAPISAAQSEMQSNFDSRFHHILTGELDCLDVGPLDDFEFKFDAENAMEMDKDRVDKFFREEIPEYLDTSQWDRQENLKNAKYVLIDLSGTLHIEDVQTPDAVSAIENLRLAGFKLLFVTNTTKESKRVLHERLLRIGFKIEKDEIFSSLSASRVYVEKLDLRPMFMIADEAMEDFEGINVENPNAVLVGLSSKDFNYETLNRAFRLLIQKEDAVLLAVHKGRSYQTSTGTSIGPGPFVVALETSTNKTATVLGKPNQTFFYSALDFMGCKNFDEADIRDDVMGAMQIGVTGILVQTGKYSVHDDKKIHPHLPDFKVKNFCEAVDLIIETVADGMGLRSNLSSAVLAASILIKRRSNSPKP